MTDQQYTPDTERIKDDYRRSRVWESGNGSEAYKKEFDRWLATVEAAAEQRGAIKALREAADDSLGRAGHPYKWMMDRADQIEVDDERN